MIGAMILALMAAPPATQTCPDGSVILASESCGAPARPPATQTCPDGSVILASETCVAAALATLTCNSTAGSRSPVSGKLFLRESTIELDLADGRNYIGTTDTSDAKAWRSRMWTASRSVPAAFEISDSADEGGVFSAKLDAVLFACKLD